MSQKSSNELLQEYFQAAAKQGDLQLQSDMLDAALANSMIDMRKLNKLIGEAKAKEAAAPAPVAVSLPVEAPAASVEVQNE